MAVTKLEKGQKWSCGHQTLLTGQSLVRRIDSGSSLKDAIYDENIPLKAQQAQKLVDVARWANTASRQTLIRNCRSLELCYSFTRFFAA